MKANCPQCSTVLTIDDAKVPDRPFSLKCPKCQGLVRMQGKSAAPAPPPAPEPPAVIPRPPGPPVPSPSTLASMPSGPALAPPPPATALAQPKAPVAPGANVAPAGTALVALGRGEDAVAVTGVLTGLGYRVEFAAELDESVRLLDEGVYAVLVTDWAGDGSMCQRVTQILPETRRPIFLVLVGDDFKTGDGTRAWTVLADLVVNRADLGVCSEILKRTLSERTRLFKPLLEVQERAVSAYR